MPIIFLLFTLFSVVTTANSLQPRRLLHQPFFPVINTSPPPVQAPSPSPLPHHQQRQLPKYPFSTTPPNNSTQKPFFPSYQATPPSPPPPPSSILSTFPANISSLLFPHRPSTASAAAHRHLILLSVSLSLLFAALLAAILALLLYFRHRRGGISSEKTSRSDSQRLFPPNLPPSDATHKTSATTAAVAQRSVSSSTPPTTSSEFLYLGTLVNSHSSQKTPPRTNVGVRIGVSTSPTAYHKLGSPELKPLPPLPKYNSSFTSGEMCFSKEETKFETSEDEEDDDDEQEEFFSPRGSSGRKESPNPNQSPTRVGSGSRRENMGSRSFNSRTASYPYTNSNSPSNSISSSCQSPVPNLSPKSISSSLSVLSRSDSGKVSGFLNQIKLPPPPPPPPPPRFWEIPGVVKPNSGLPVLVPTSRPGFGAPGQVMKNESAETTLKPKLKPLHWDKVRASSDRAMVWDQLKSSSFQ